MNKLHLKNLYDCINDIARKHQAKGKNRDNWFYSDAEFNQIKRDKQNNIF